VLSPMEISVFSEGTSVHIKIISWLSIAIVSIFSFLLAESWIIGLVALLGGIKAFFILSIICTFISFAIVYFYDSTEAKRGRFSVSQRIRTWVTRKEKSLNPTALKLARTSKLFALIFLTVTAGPFLTTVMVKVLGYKKWTDYSLSFLSSALFSLVWATVYSGSITILARIFVR